MEPFEAAQKAARDILQYHGLLDPTQQTIINAIAWCAAFSLLVNSGHRIAKNSKKNLGGDIARFVSCQSMPKINVPRINAPRIRLPGGRQKPADGPKKPVADPPRLGRKRNKKDFAVVEVDFIRSATPDDLDALLKLFGFCLAPRESIMQMMAMDHVRQKLQGFLIAVTVNPEDMAYPCVALALQSRALLLTNSENIQRLCKSYGIRTAGTDTFRSQAKAGC